MLGLVAKVDDLVVVVLGKVPDKSGMLPFPTWFEARGQPLPNCRRYSSVQSSWEYSDDADGRRLDLVDVVHIRGSEVAFLWTL